MKHLHIIILGAAAMLFAVACEKTPTKTYVNFGSSSYSFAEDAGSGSIKLYEYYTPYKFPIEVTIRMSVESGNVKIGEMIAFDEPEFTVTAEDDNNLLLSGVEITIDNNTTIPFTIIDNDYLQNETFKIRCEIVAVDGSEKGSIYVTDITIVDNEYAPRIVAGYYTAEYTPSTGAERESAGKFTFRLQKIGKYEYMIESLFGLDDNYPPRPRLVGTFDPAARTLTFDGTDYDERTAAENDSSYQAQSAFGNTYFFYTEALDKVLVFEGAGVSGKGDVVFTTEAIAQDASGKILSATTGCSFVIYNYSIPADAESITDGDRGTRAGIWDGFETATFTYIGTTLPTKATAHGTALIPFK